MKSLIQICTLIFFSYNVTKCQPYSFNILNEINSELFPVSTDSIRLIDFLNDCKNHKIDHSIYVRSKQPDKDRVLEILKKIAYSKNTLFQKELEEIYFNHLNFYEKEWMQVNRDNFYSCEIIRNQTRILNGFENTLKSLSIANLAHNEKFDLYYNEKLLDVQLIRNGGVKNEIIDKYKVFNAKYKEIFRDAWLQGGANFTFIDPFVKDIEKYLIGKILELQYIDDVSDENYFVINNMHNLISKINTDEMSTALKLISNKMIQINRDYFIVYYLSINTDEELLRDFLKNKVKFIYHNFSDIERNTLLELTLTLILKNTNNFDIVLDEFTKFEQNIENEHNIRVLLKLVKQTQYENLLNEWVKRDENGYQYFLMIENKNIKN